MIALDALRSTVPGFEDSIGIFPEFLDGYNVLVLPGTGRYFQIPYRALVPRGDDNLLVAGRAVAGDRISHTAMRNMMACTVTGQGADELHRFRISVIPSASNLFAEAGRFKRKAPKSGSPLRPAFHDCPLPESFPRSD